jgi:hypothetical protein
LTYLYHCFPRVDRRRLSAEDSVTRGLRILELILRIGVLLVPEEINWRVATTLEDGTTREFPLLGIFSFLQRRFCLTALREDELAPHCKVFGPFAIELPLDSARDLGATPVFYVALDGSAPTDGSARNQIAMTAVRLAEIAELLRRIARVSTPEVVAATRGLLEHLGPVDELRAAMVTAFGLLYPTERLDSEQSEMLEYFRQREWRILGNAVVAGRPIDETLTDDERAEVSAISPEFFSRVVKSHGGTEYRVKDLCTVIRQIRGRPVGNLISRVLVPPECIDRVRVMIESLGYKIVVERSPP